MRSAVVSMLVLLAACPASREVGQSSAGDDGALAPSNSACRIDSDCLPAAASCCECPTFSVNRDDPTQAACVDVNCPPSGGCADNVRAACEGGECMLACVPLACPETCSAGYAMDPTGCLSCACAVPDPGGCSRDEDCVETRAACCGCAQGGSDTAVLVRDQAAFDAALGCSASPQCPAIDACEPGAVPACIQGRCELTSGGGLPPNACGRADLPTCPAGTVCTVNASAPGNEQGVGVCVQP